MLNKQCSRLSELKENFMLGVDADAEAYNDVMAAFKASKDDEKYAENVSKTMKNATKVPLNTAVLAREVERILEGLKPITNPNMTSDLTTGIALARAAFTGAMANVEINLSGMDQASEFVREVRREIAGLV